MYILNSEQSREADRQTTENIGVPARVLMENAGREVVRSLERAIPDLKQRTIGILCGKGNNGGDGLVVLRCLASRGYDVRAWVLGPFESLTADALNNLQTALKLELPVEAIETEEDWTHRLKNIGRMSVLVDAILGTGLKEPAHGLVERAIEDINALNAFKVSVDLPSGLSADSGRVPGTAVRADRTIALATAKVCHYVTPASEFCGELDVAEIGIPARFLNNPSSPRIEVLDPSRLRELLPKRRRTSHKGSFGHLLIVAGSRGKTGAAVMAAEAALRSGVGLVTVASAASAISSMAPRLPEAMWEPLDETAEGSIASSSLEHLLEMMKNRSALAIGPGLGTSLETSELVRAILQQLRIPAVIDADGLNAIASLDTLPPNQPIALTPHPGEAARMLALKPSAVQQDRIRAIRKLTRLSKAHVLLKGYRSLIADGAGNLTVNTTGNAGMATAGSGDVLTGIIGALMAQGLWIADALNLGTHLHGLAGDLAAAQTGQTSLIATDLTRHLPDAFRSLEPS